MNRRHQNVGCSVSMGPAGQLGGKAPLVWHLRCSLMLPAGLLRCSTHVAVGQQFKLTHAFTCIRAARPSLQVSKNEDEMKAAATSASKINTNRSCRFPFPLLRR